MDHFSNSINKICNAFIINLEYVIINYSKVFFNILKILKNQGYIEKFFFFKENFIKFLIIKLKYYKNKSVIRVFKRISKPSFKIYRRHNNIPKVMNGLGILIVSTSKGLLTDLEARNLGFGGELLCYVF